MSVAEFKRAIVHGAKVDSTLSHKDRTGKLKLVNEFKERTVVRVQSNFFVLLTPSAKDPGKMVDSWCEWPKANELQRIDTHTWKITFSFGELVYRIL